jgi:hypothetical protein
VTERHKATSFVKYQGIPLHVQRLQNNTEVWDGSSGTSYVHGVVSAHAQLIYELPGFM